VLIGWDRSMKTPDELNANIRGKIEVIAEYH
jgi:hypothetical protein